jgi:hypothetical protein
LEVREVEADFFDFIEKLGHLSRLEDFEQGDPFGYSSFFVLDRDGGVFAVEFFGSGSNILNERSTLDLGFEEDERFFIAFANPRDVSRQRVIIS